MSFNARMWYIRLLWDLSCRTTPVIFYHCFSFVVVNFSCASRAWCIFEVKISGTKTSKPILALAFRRKCYWLYSIPAGIMCIINSNQYAKEFAAYLLVPKAYFLKGVFHVRGFEKTNFLLLHISDVEVIRNMPYEWNPGIHFSWRVIQRPLGDLPRASALDGYAVTPSSKTNIGDLVKLYCHVFSNVLWVCVTMCSFEKRFLGYFSLNANFKSESSRSLRSYEIATHIVLIIFNERYAAILKILNVLGISRLIFTDLISLIKSIVTLFQTCGKGSFKVAHVKIIFYQNNISKVGECINKRQETVSNYHV